MFVAGTRSGNRSCRPFPRVARIEANVPANGNILRHVCLDERPVQARLSVSSLSYD